MVKRFSMLLVVFLILSIACNAYAQRGGASLKEDRYELLGWVNVKESPHGAKGNGTTDDSVAFISACAAAINKILYIPPGTYKLSNNVTAGASVEVWFSNGVTLSVDNTKTFTISGKLHTPFIPTNSGAGTFDYSAASRPLTYDAQVNDIAGLTPADSAFIVGDGTNFVTETEGTARTSLGLGSMATQNATAISVTGGTMSGISPILNPALAVDHTVSGLTAPFVAGVAVAIGDACYLDSNGKMQLGDADALATASAVFIVADATIAQDTSGSFILIGFIRDDSWNWTTIGGWVYLSTNGTTGNTLTQTAPSDAGDIVQVIGIAISADVIYILPNLIQIEVD